MILIRSWGSDGRWYVLILNIGSSFLAWFFPPKSLSTYSRCCFHHFFNYHPHLGKMSPMLTIIFYNWVAKTHHCSPYCFWSPSKIGNLFFSTDPYIGCGSWESSIVEVIFVSAQITGSSTWKVLIFEEHSCIHWAVKFGCPIFLKFIPNTWLSEEKESSHFFGGGGWALDVVLLILNLPFTCYFQSSMFVCL